MTREGFSTCSCGSQRYMAAQRDGILVHECSSCRKPWEACSHAAYHFALLDGVRYCQCNSCGHQWSIYLGKRVQFRDSEETDSIANTMTGLEYIEKARRAVRVARR